MPKTVKKRKTTMEPKRHGTTRSTAGNKSTRADAGTPESSSSPATEPESMCQSKLENKNHNQNQTESNPSATTLSPTPLPTAIASPLVTTEEAKKANFLQLIATLGALWDTKTQLLALERRTTPPAEHAERANAMYNYFLGIARDLNRFAYRKGWDIRVNMDDFCW